MKLLVIQNYYFSQRVRHHYSVWLLVTALLSHCPLLVVLSKSLALILQQKDVKCVHELEDFNKERMDSPWSFIRGMTVDIFEGHPIFSRLLVVRNCVMVKSVSPQYFWWKVRSPHLPQINGFIFHFSIFLNIIRIYLGKPSEVCATHLKFCLLSSSDSSDECIRLI